MNKHGDPDREAWKSKSAEIRRQLEGLLGGAAQPRPAGAVKRPSGVGLGPQETQCAGTPKYGATINLKMHPA